jgi:hypothetical protein
MRRVAALVVLACAAGAAEAPTAPGSPAQDDAGARPAAAPAPVVQRAPVPALPFAIAASVSPDRVLIGERAILTLAIDAPASLVTVRPRLEDRLGELEVLGVEASAETRTIDRWRQRWAISIASFETGRVDVPELPIEYVTVDGRTFAAAWPPAAALQVTGPAVSADTALRGLSGRADAPAPSRWRAVAIGAGIVAVVAPLLGVPIARWWTRRINHARHAAFYQALTSELAGLAASPCADAGDARARYMRASALVRQGAAPAAGGAVDALTSAELARRIAAAPGGLARLSTRLGVLLRAIDAIRFGNVAPAAAQHSATLVEAQGVVTGLASTGPVRAPDGARRKDAP